MGAEDLPLTPDFNTYAMHPRIEAVGCDDGTVEIRWDDGHEGRFHFLWLRDTCPCPHCINPVTREQILDISTVAADVHPVSVDLDGVGVLSVMWSDSNHVSRYHPGWLRAHCYSNDEQNAHHAPHIITWEASFAAQVPTFDGPGVLEDDDTLYEWLIALREYGLTRLESVPTEALMIERVAARIGTVRETNFGRLFDVCSKPDPDSNAYTPLELLPHTDLPTRELQPGIQMLHCLTNTARGGKSVMVDGFYLADVLRREYPEHFEVLTRVPLSYHNRAKTTDYRWRAPMLSLDATGQITEVRPGMLLRAPLDVPFEEVESVYAALQTFYRLIRDDAYRAVFPIKSGDVLAFDNRRVLHGREAYNPTSGERHLKGCYLDRDELLSRIRVLQRKLKRP